MATPQTIKKDGRTLYRVQIRRPTKGIKIDEYFSRKRDAEAYIREVEHAVKSGRPVTENVQARKTFAEAVDAYLKDSDAFKTPKGRELKDSAKKDREWRIKWLSRKPDRKAKKQSLRTGGDFGDILLKNLSWEQIDARLSKLSKAHGWSPATRYRYETTLSRFFDYCRSNGWAAYNVMADQKRLNESGMRERTYTDQEWKTLLEVADRRGGVLGMFLRLAWETGARRGELLNLRWVDIEPTEQEGLGAGLFLRDTKNRDSRTVFISEKTYRLLLAHEQEFRRDDSPLIFPSRKRDGRYLKIVKDFRDARAEAKLDQPDEKYGEVLSIHHIRHTWATRLGDSGATLAQLMAAGGWKSPEIAMRYMKRKETQAAEAALLLMDT